METPIVQSVLTIAAGIYCGPQCAAAASAAFTAINGGSLSDVLFAAAVAYVSAEAFAEVGKAFPEGDFLTAARLKRTLAHGVVGGAMAEASGGRFRDGFVGAGAAQLAAPWIDGLDTGNSGISHARVTAAAVVGGTASKLGGGKFANGAVTAAFGRLFNDEADRLRQQQEAKLLGEVNGVGSSRTFDADNRIRVEPYSHTLGPDSFFYEIDYHYYDTNDRLIPNYVPSDAWGNAVPAFTGRALPGFGGGGPDQVFVAPMTSNHSSGRVQWRVTIPRQPPTHGNSAGWNLRVYELQ